jgi:hypothetical protein
MSIFAYKYCNFNFTELKYFLLYHKFAEVLKILKYFLLYHKFAEVLKILIICLLSIFIWPLDFLFTIY